MYYTTSEVTKWSKIMEVSVLVLLTQTFMTHGSPLFTFAAFRVSRRNASLTTGDHSNTRDNSTSCLLRRSEYRDTEGW